LWVYEQWKWLKTLQADKSSAELELLKTQINPHFFFNTLNNLYSLTVTRSEKAPEVILKLSDMMRYTIYEGKKELVPLKSEIEYLENYIELHRIRYKKSVKIAFDHDIDSNTEISPLLFIILLENAFKHGIDTLSDAAYISMKLTQNEKEIDFSIENNFDPKEISVDKGIGLENLKRRLDLIYPRQHELIIAQENNVFNVNLKVTIK
jgi:LytS/YehU family sensor histidine kinase